MRPLCMSTSTSAKCAAKALMRCVVLPAVVWAVPTISPGRPATAAAKSRRRCGASALLNWPASRRTAGACSRAIGLAPLPPADAFGPRQDAFPQAITGERHPAFHRLIGEELVGWSGALTRLPDLSDMKLQAIVERVEA